MCLGERNICRLYTTTKIHKLSIESEAEQKNAFKNLIKIPTHTTGIFCLQLIVLNTQASQFVPPSTKSTFIHVNNHCTYVDNKLTVSITSRYASSTLCLSLVLFLPSAAVDALDVEDCNAFIYHLGLVTTYQSASLGSTGPPP